MTRRPLSQRQRLVAAAAFLALLGVAAANLALLVALASGGARATTTPNIVGRAVAIGVTAPTADKASP